MKFIHPYAIILCYFKIMILIVKDFIRVLNFPTKWKSFQARNRTQTLIPNALPIELCEWHSNRMIQFTQITICQWCRICYLKQQILSKLLKFYLNKLFRLGCHSDILIGCACAIKINSYDSQPGHFSHPVRKITTLMISCNLLQIRIVYLLLFC